MANAAIKYQDDAIRFAITHSSLKNLPEKCLRSARKTLGNVEPSKVPVSLAIKTDLTP